MYCNINIIMTHHFKQPQMKEVALCLLLVAMATFSEGTIEFPKEWLSWKSEHGKSYESELEELGKHVTWMANKKFIDIHNLYKEKFGFTLAMNHFGDLVSYDYNYHGNFGMQALILRTEVFYLE